MKEYCSLTHSFFVSGAFSERLSGVIQNDFQETESTISNEKSKVSRLQEWIFSRSKTPKRFLPKEKVVDYKKVDKVDNY
jgi:hypothetical protein